MTIETNGDNYLHAENNQSISNNSFEDEKSEKKKDEDIKEELKMKKQNFNWFKYMWYLISCFTSNTMIRQIEKIRKNMISEENIIQNYFDIYNLLHINRLPRKSVLNY